MWGICWALRRRLFSIGVVEADEGVDGDVENGVGVDEWRDVGKGDEKKNSSNSPEEGEDGERGFELGWFEVVDTGGVDEFDGDE